MKRGVGPARGSIASHARDKNLSYTIGDVTDSSIFVEATMNYDNHKKISMGNAAETLLKSAAVQEFFSTKDRELFDEFNRLGPSADLDSCRAVISNQNVLSDLLIHMRRLVLERDVIIQRNGGDHDSEEEERRGGPQDEFGRERETILGLSGTEPPGI